MHHFALRKDPPGSCGQNGLEGAKWVQRNWVITHGTADSWDLAKREEGDLGVEDGLDVE